MAVGAWSQKVNAFLGFRNNFVIAKAHKITKLIFTKKIFFSCLRLNITQPAIGVWKIDQNLIESSIFYSLASLNYEIFI